MSEDEGHVKAQPDCAYQDSDCWVRQLRAAGWTAVVLKHRPARWESVSSVTTTWMSPAGNLYRGPFGAWKLMKAGAK